MLRGTRFPALPTLVVFRNSVVTMNLFRHLTLTRILDRCGLLLVGLVALQSIALADTRVRLTRDGKPLASIVTAARPSPSARLAALEIQSHVQRISGTTLPIVSDDTPVGTGSLRSRPGSVLPHPVMQGTASPTDGCRRLPMTRGACPRCV